ncbi:MAG: M50 family metallopeptidase, partial [Candidatus Rokuibacteriota bacterium]
MGGVLTLFRIRGIPVRVHASWLVVFGLIAWSLSVGYFPQQLPGLPLVTHWANGLLAALLLFVSVFLHELSHSLVALSYGIPVASITLHVFGGVSQMEREPDRPGVEFVVAVVGPLTSFAIAAVIAVLQAVLTPSAAAAAIMRYLVLVNTVVGIFNLVPGFPLDGGRVLRAGLWKARGDLRWATRVASGAGSAFAFLLIAVGLWQAVAGEFLGGLWFVLIGLFLRQAAVGSYQQLMVRRVLEPLAVRDVMTRDVIHVSPGLPLARVVDEFFWPHHVSSFPVVDDGRVVGIVSVHDLARIPRDRWSAARVAEVMQPLEARRRASPDESLWDAFQKLSQNGVGR